MVPIGSLFVNSWDLISYVANGGSEMKIREQALHTAVRRGCDLSYEDGISPTPQVPCRSYNHFDREGEGRGRCLAVTRGSVQLESALCCEAAYQLRCLSTGYAEEQRRTHFPSACRCRVRSFMGPFLPICFTGVSGSAMWCW